MNWFFKSVTTSLKNLGQPRVSSKRDRRVRLQVEALEERLGEGRGFTTGYETPLACDCGCE